jgi:hypothetical protein
MAKSFNDAVLTRHVRQQASNRYFMQTYFNISVTFLAYYITFEMVLLLKDAILGTSDRYLIGQTFTAHDFLYGAR